MVKNVPAWDSYRNDNPGHAVVASGAGFAAIWHLLCSFGAATARFVAVNAC